MYKHILLPTDGSALAREAIHVGVKLAKALGARVTGFYAAPPATPIEYKGLLPVGYLDPAKREKMIEKTAANYLEVVEKAAKAAGVPYKVEHVTSDYPADAIIAAARKNKCDLIFMASHGRRGSKGVLIGSETQKVLTQTKIPVLVCR